MKNLFLSAYGRLFRAVGEEELTILRSLLFIFFLVYFGTTCYLVT
jgi:hypothetical protein